MKNKIKNHSQKLMDFKKYGIVGILLLVHLILWRWFPHLAKESGRASLNSFLDIIMIMPGIAILMGLFDVWVPESLIRKYMGKESGIKAYFLAFIFGTMPTGPLYVAFPLALGFLQKGASISAIVVFLSIWAAVKIPQIMVEIKFLGFSFALTRLILTILSIVIMSIIIEKLIQKQDIIRFEVEENK